MVIDDYKIIVPYRTNKHFLSQANMASTSRLPGLVNLRRFGCDSIDPVIKE